MLLVKTENLNFPLSAKSFTRVKTMILLWISDIWFSGFMDDPIEDFDENGNFNLRFGIGQYTPEQQARIDSFQNEKGIPPISRSFYEATSPSTDYVDNATNSINNLLNERTKTESNDGDYEMVFVWDIGEITTLSARHFVQLYTSHRETNAHALIDISKRVLKNENFNLVYDVLNVVNIEDIDEAESEEMKQRAPSYYALEKLYNEISYGMIDNGPLISYELLKKSGLVDRVRELYFGAIQLQILFHQRWKTARKCLEIINEQSAKSHRKHANVIVTEDGIGNGAVQLMIAGCSKYIPFENIYCYVKESMKMTLERIKRRFGEKCVLVFITSGPNKALIPENLQVPIWEVKANDSIEHLSNALQNNLFR